MKTEAAIIRYELARQKIIELEALRSELARRCTATAINDPEMVLTAESARLCLERAYDEMKQMEYDGERPDYWEVLNGYYHDPDEKGYCEHCIKSYDIKRNELAAARQEFGAAKRSIAAIGMRLIKEG